MSAPLARLRHRGEQMLLGVRVLLGVWLACASLWAHHLRGPVGLSDLACAALIVGISVLALWRPNARFALLALSTWLGMSAFVLRGASIYSWPNEYLVASCLIFISVPAGDWFDD